jgi:cytochrome oxidase Cu insertion factor (SCO1/SenC/PrrC family)
MRRSWILAVALLLLSVAPTHAHDQSKLATKTRAAPAAPDLSREERARAYFTDLPLIAQDGREMRFYSDVLKDKTVLIYMFFASCTDACPLLNAKLAKVEELLGDRAGRDILLISLTVDPKTDTPETLRRYAESFGAAPSSWLFLTGPDKNVDTITRKLGHTAPDPAGHLSWLLLGNTAKGRWTKLPPNLPEPAIAERLRLLADGPG